MHIVFSHLFYFNEIDKKRKKNFTFANEGAKTVISISKKKNYWDFITSYTSAEKLIEKSAN
jgi:hypothetical protein